MKGNATDQPKRSSEKSIGRRIPALLAALAVVALACTCSNLVNPAQLLRSAVPEEADQVIGQIEGTLQAVSTPPTPGPGGGQPLPDLVASGQLDVLGVEGTADSETMGRILSVQIANLGSGEVIVEIPCGLVFEPSGGGLQRMMVIQPSSAALGAGDSGELEPYVVCIDPEQEAPSIGTTFQIGTMASGDLHKLASCICDQPLEGELSLQAGADVLGVQMAVWAVATGDSPRALMERDLGGAAGDALGEQGAQFLGDMMEMLLMPANAWLERCGVELAE